jgi:hypothetical protein
MLTCDQMAGSRLFLRRHSSIGLQEGSAFGRFPSILQEGLGFWGPSASPAQNFSVNLGAGGEP